MEKDVLLNKRTKEALSSYISENLFEKRFLNESKVLFSKDWWYADGGQKKYWFITKNLLSDLDKEISNLIKQTEKFQVILNGDEISIRDLNTKREFTVKSFLESYPHIARKNHKGDIKNQKIKDKYYTYFLKNNLLDNIEKSIFLEDEFLNKYFYTSNIDFICKNEIALFALEVKYKYKTKDGDFGINVMQYEILKGLNLEGVIAVNIILENISRVDILEKNEDASDWLYSRIQFNKEVVKDAQSKSSYFVHREQKYRVMPGKDYVKLKSQCNFLNLKCPSCGAKLILRTGTYGDFLGCKNFSSNNCKGTLKF